MTATKAIRCQQCRKRCRRTEGWNAEFIVGMVVGYTCPQCQLPEENAEAAINEVLSPPSGWQLTAAESLVGRLVRSYPTPERLRHQASRLAAARTDQQARSVVALMNRTAAAMDDGTLWSDPDPA